MPKQPRLYKYYDENGDLLYVGISLNPVVRLADHNSKSFWADAIRRVEIEFIPDEFAPSMFERKIIMEENPKHNIVHKNGKSWGRPPKHDYSKEDCELIRLLWKNGDMKTNRDRVASVRTKFPEFNETAWYRLQNAGKV